MNDACKTYQVDNYTVQENGIIRHSDGHIVGRLSDLEGNEYFRGYVDGLKRAKEMILELPKLSTRLSVSPQRLAEVIQNEIQEKENG